MLFVKPKNIMNLENFTKRKKTNKASIVINEIADYMWLVSHLVLCYMTNM
jgi:hypothetical protein